jgi:hypothetical protein
MAQAAVNNTRWAVNAALRALTEGTAASGAERDLVVRWALSRLAADEPEQVTGFPVWQVPRLLLGAALAVGDGQVRVAVPPHAPPCTLCPPPSPCAHAHSSAQEAVNGLEAALQLFPAGSGQLLAALCEPNRQQLAATLAAEHARQGRPAASSAQLQQLAHLGAADVVLLWVLQRCCTRHCEDEAAQLLAAGILAAWWVRSRVEHRGGCIPWPAPVTPGHGCPCSARPAMLGGWSAPHCTLCEEGRLHMRPCLRLLLLPCSPGHLETVALQLQRLPLVFEWLASTLLAWLRVAALDMPELDHAARHGLVGLCWASAAQGGALVSGLIRDLVSGGRAHRWARDRAAAALHAPLRSGTAGGAGPNRPR